MNDQWTHRNKSITINKCVAWEEVSRIHFISCICISSGLFASSEAIWSVETNVMISVSRSEELLQLNKQITSGVTTGGAAVTRLRTSPQSNLNSSHFADEGGTFGRDNGRCSGENEAVNWCDASQWILRAGAVSLVGGVQHCSTAALLQPSYLVLDPVKLQPGLQLQAERGDGGDLQQGGC